MAKQTHAKRSELKNQLLAYGDEIISYAIADLKLNIKADLSDATPTEVQKLLTHIMSEPN